MSLDLNDLFVDPEVGQEGVWVDFYNGSRLKVASTESPKYKSYLAKLARQNKLQLDDANDDSAALVQEITADALSKHVLLDWESVSISGQPNVAYTPEIGKQALLMAPKLREFVMDQAGSSNLFKKKVVEEVKKSSDGNSPGGVVSMLSN
jgi:hypothetical protein